MFHVKRLRGMDQSLAGRKLRIAPKGPGSQRLMGAANTSVLPSSEREKAMIDPPAVIAGVKLPIDPGASVRAPLLSSYRPVRQHASGERIEDGLEARTQNGLDARVEIQFHDQPFSGP